MCVLFLAATLPQLVHAQATGAAAGSSPALPHLRFADITPDTDIFVNGTLKGTGVSQVELILPGEYTVSVRRRGFRPWTQTVTVVNNETIDLQPVFEPFKIAIFPIQRAGVWAGNDTPQSTAAWVTNAASASAVQAGLVVSHTVHVWSRDARNAEGEDLSTIQDIASESWSFTGGPDVEYVAKKGAEIGTDAVLLIKITTQTQTTGLVQAYLIESGSGRMETGSGIWGYGYTAHRDVMRLVTPLLEKFKDNKVRAVGKQVATVLELEAEDAEPGAVYAIGEALRAEMRATGRYTVVNGTEQAAILDRVAPKKLICTAVECALEVGKLLQVDKVVAGRVTGLSANSWRVSVIQVDVATGETITSESIVHSGDLANAGKTLSLLANELAVTASPAGVNFRRDQSRWRWKSGLLFGGAALMVLSSGYLSSELEASNERQKDYRILAEQALTTAEFDKFKKKLEDEKSTGESLRNQAIAAQILAGILLWWGWSTYSDPPELPPVAWQVQPAPTANGAPAVAMSYRW